MSLERRNALVTWGLVAAGALLLAPMIPAVMMALWLGAFARTAHRPLTRALGGRIRLAAALTLIAVSVVVVPFVLLITSLAIDAVDLVDHLLASERGKEVLERLVAPEDPAAPGTSSVLDLLLRHKERSWALLQEVAVTATRIVIALFVILAGTYAFLVEGERWYRWVEAHAPISPALLDRLRDAFFETGRGLFIGIGGAGLIQSAIATIAYLALGVPRPLELGLLTFCFSIIPAIGTALVWIPIAGGLALAGRHEAAFILVAVGVLVIGTVDNLVRPLLARWGRLQLPTYVVLISMFAGVLAIGAWGLLVAPLAVRLAKAALESERAPT
jgi:predicted PurR-regulated permease PerM